MMGNVIANVVANIIKEISSVADNYITTNKDKERFKQDLTGVVLKYTAELAKMQAEVLKTELTGNWLQRSWRPIVMLSFAFVVFYGYFIAPVFGLINVDFPQQFWELLKIGIGGYVIGRTTEKVADRVTKNMDINLLKRKDRKDKYNK